MVGHDVGEKVAKKPGVNIPSARKKNMFLLGRGKRVFARQNNHIVWCGENGSDYSIVLVVICWFGWMRLNARK